MKRRDFLAASLCAPMLACTAKTEPPLPPGSSDGSGAELGHRLRGEALAAPVEVRRVPLLLVGAGIAGLSAAWKLQRAGFEDFLVLDLESRPGGNARYGANAISAYPLGAHYLPLPTREATATRELLADLGALQGDARAPQPTYEERLLCHVPQERLYIDGVWQEGLLPRLGVGGAEAEQLRRFLQAMGEWREARDTEGRRAFALPVAWSSPRAEWRALDRLSMRDWLLAKGYTAPQLHWYVNYACRDDYGSDYRHTSAWASIHYFACRNGAAANAASDAVLTAPAGNGWIVEALARRLGPRLQTQALVFRLSQTRRSVMADVWLAAEKRAVRYVADQAIWCAPLFALARLGVDLPAALAQAARAGSYAPWLVANLSLAEAPAPGAGAPLSWDNVLYAGAGLGYVVATHQQMQLRPGPTVLTYYRACSEVAPQLARQTLLGSTREQHAAAILEELGRAHADLRRLTTRLDIVRHGHAMIRPTPGSLWGAPRQALSTAWGRVHLAHADLSGLSLFEEANYHGVAAAEAVLSRLRIAYATSLQ